MTDFSDDHGLSRRSFVSGAGVALAAGTAAAGASAASAAAPASRGRFAGKVAWITGGARGQGRSHAERLYAAAVTPDTDGARLLLDRVRAGRLGDGFTPRQVAVKHWAGLATPDAVRKAAELLVEHGWLRLDVVAAGASGGRPSERYLIHPALLNGGEA